MRPAAIPRRAFDSFGSEGFEDWLDRHAVVGGFGTNRCRIKGSLTDLYLYSHQDFDESAVRWDSPTGSSASERLVRLQYPGGETVVRQDSLDDKCPWLDPVSTDAYCCQAGNISKLSSVQVVRLGDAVLLQSPNRPSPAQVVDAVERLAERRPVSACYWKCHDRQMQSKEKTQLSPELVWGKPADPSHTIKEWGVRYRLDFAEGYSVGLFLDQRENRFRLRHDLVAPGFSAFPASRAERPSVLNTFAYTCGFSVCAALAGARVVSVDLSKKYLAWGKENFGLNDLDAEEHEFLYGDVFGWLKRFARRQEQFDVIVLDPPTFSRSKEFGVFRVSQDLPKLVSMALPLLVDGGRLLVSSNAARWRPSVFQAAVSQAVRNAGRRIGRQQWATQPWDFGFVNGSDAYLKTWWIEVLG